MPLSDPWPGFQA